MRLLILLLGVLVFAFPAHANIPDYCAAYARDIADMGAKSDDWQRRHDNAQASCVTRFSAFETAPVKNKVKPKPKSVAAIKPAKPKVELKTEANTETVPDTKVVAKVVSKLEPGSAEWTAYCKQKYVSFDESKGTYTSKTGVERKCMVTAD